MKVYVLAGWFGDVGWIEAICADAETAEAACNELWKERRSTNPDVPDYVQGLCKFAVEEHDVIGSRVPGEGPFMASDECAVCGLSVETRGPNADVEYMENGRSPRHKHCDPKTKLGTRFEWRGLFGGP